jgi:hypothetical protein
MFVDVYRRKLQSGLCQNCVRCPAKARSIMVSDVATPMHIAVAGICRYDLQASSIAAAKRRGTILSVATARKKDG